jgi:Holliday junction resolvase RusA-like endonuclease
LEGIKMALPFEPVPKGRPRFNIIRGHVHTFTPRKTKEFEYCVAEYYKGAAGGCIFAKGVPITVSIIFGMPIPASASKKRKAEMLEDHIKHTVKPDCDNLIKAILDALNGVAWYDDAQIVSLNVQKKYVETPNIYITIQKID